MMLPINKFFDEAIGPGRALVFTTFSLDEQVLVELLRKHNIPTDQRIVVFHDVMKHHAPGFLRQHYRQSLVVSVEIIGTQGARNKCPIFHSKLWLAVEKKPFRCRVLAVPSLNLRRYHLDQSAQTFETFPWWSNLSLPLDQMKWMTKNFLFHRRGLVRHKISCATIEVDARTGSPTRLVSWRKPAIQVIRGILSGEEPIGCAAPFASRNAISRIFQNAIAKGRVPFVWMDRRSDGTCLHAKLLTTRKYLVLGSTNLTCQALGIGQFLNHETVVAALRGTLNLAKLLRGFSRIDYSELNAPEEPGDWDENDKPCEPWLEHRRQALNGPRQVVLELNNGTPQICLSGSLGGATRIVITSLREGSPVPMDLKAARRLRFKSHESELQLAEHIFATPVEVRGRRNGQDVWTRELDCDSFWAVLENNASHLLELRTKLSQISRRRKPLARTTASSYGDVRDSRTIAYLDPKLGHDERDWQIWLIGLSRDLPVQVIPAWCVNLAQRIR